MDFKIWESRAVAQGRKKLLRERATYLLVIRQDFRHSLVCRAVGINEKASRRWRSGVR
ncbi:hypothetical protein ACWF95_36770 [Streptomyces vinaceus]